MVEEKNKKENRIVVFFQKILPYMWFPVSILFWEIVIAFSTGTHMKVRYGIYVVLFSVSYGLLFYLLGTITKNKRINTVCQCILLLFFSVIYLAIYYLYCEFQVFYDFNTMFAGATDAVTDFAGDILGMICTVDGFLHLILFLLPVAGFLVYGRKTTLVNSISWGQRGVIFVVSLVLFWFDFCLIASSAMDYGVYGKSYHYDTAIEEFGLMTGIRLECQNLWKDKNEKVQFEIVEQPEGEVIETEPTEELSTEVVKEDSEASAEILLVEEPKIPQGKNEVSLDFEALAQKDGGRYQELDAYVASLESSDKNAYTGLFEGKNLIFLTAEAFTAEVIDKELTPTLYRLANSGIQFTDFYQPSGAGTTGGECCNLLGMLPVLGGNSVKKTAKQYNWTTLASRLSEKGYYGKAYHNNDYKYYDRDKTHINLGFSDGYEGYGNGIEKVITSQWPESDVEMLQGTLSNYINKKPFFIYYMTVSGHSLYSVNKNAMSKKHWEQVQNLEYSDPVKAYIACQLELEEALTYLVEQLERLDMAEDTVIVISADHFPYGLDQNSGSFTYLSELYGQKIENDFVRDHNRLIVWSGCLEGEEPIVVDTPTSSIDILPTLCNLFGVEYDSRLLTGRDVFSDTEPLVYTLGYDWKTTQGTYIASRGKFTPAKGMPPANVAYIEKMNAIVHNKIKYCKTVLQQDYFRHLFELGSD